MLCHRSPKVSRKIQDLELTAGLEKIRGDGGACRIRLEFLAAEVIVRSLRANLRMFHNLPVFSSLFRKRDYTVLKKI